LIIGFCFNSKENEVVVAGINKLKMNRDSKEGNEYERYGLKTDGKAEFDVNS
jgi:hypothetical protein